MKVAIYCRLSEEDRNKQAETDDSKSIQNQKALLIQYAVDRHWEIYRIYSDDDYAGADRSRPEFNQLIADAKCQKFDIVLCKTQSRFTRELELVEKYIHHLFPIWNIRFISIVDNADTNVKGNKKSRQINGLVNEWYLEDMSESIKSVLVNRRQNGLHIGSFALYGYRKDPERKGHLIIDEEAAKVVKEVFTLFSQGYGKTAIARLLNEKGIPNPTEYKRIHGLRYQQPKGKNSTLWKYFSIANMLVNEIYIGNMVQGKYGSISYKTKENKPRPKDQWFIVKGTHEPIIDYELWNQVQNMIKHKTKAFSTGTIGLFSRKVKCINCGYTMSSNKCHGKQYLKCPNRHISKDACIGSFISVDKLEQTVILELNKMVDKYLSKDELEQKVEFNNNININKEHLQTDIIKYEKKLDNDAKILREIYLDKVKGIITEKEYIEFSKGFQIEGERTKKMIAEIREEIGTLDYKLKMGDTPNQLIERYIKPEKLDRVTVERLIDYIYVGKRDTQTKEVPIEIHWNF